MRASLLHKRELVRKLRAREDLTHADAALAVDAFFDAFRRQLRDTGGVQLVGLGSFWLGTTHARYGSRRTIRYSPSSKLKRLGVVPYVRPTSS